MAKYSLMLVCLIIFILWLNRCLELITAPDTLLNIAGVLGLAALPLLGVMVKYLATFIKKKEDDRRENK